MLVGRAEELSVLNEHYNEMLSGKGNVLFITGEAGVGKTTLVREWWKTVAANGNGRNALYAEVSCSIPIGNMEMGELESFQPWADVVVRLQQIVGSEHRKIDLRQLIHEATPAWAWAIPFVGDIAHAAVQTSRLVKQGKSVGADAPGIINQQQIFQQYVNLLARVSEYSPLVIVLDDMHWADSASTNLLFYLSRQIAVKKIFVIGIYRPDEALNGYNGKVHRVIHVKNEILRYSAGRELALGYLKRTAIREWLQIAFPGYAPDDAFERWLEKISDGNCLFIEEYIKTLRENRQLNERGKFVGSYDEITIPESAFAVLEERAMRLDDETRRLLSYASVEGEEFTSYVLAKLADMEPLELLKKLDGVVRSGVILQQDKTLTFADQPTSVFRFSHSLFQQALYDSLLDEQKEFLHRTCYDIFRSEWQRAMIISKQNLFLGSKLLPHAEKCEEWETAAETVYVMAKASKENYANDDALRLIEMLMRYIGNIPPEKTLFRRADAAMLRAEVLELEGENAQARADYAEAANLFHRGGLQEEYAEALNGEAWLSFLLGKYKSAREQAAEARDYSRRIRYRKGEAEALHTVSAVHIAEGNYTESLAAMQESMAIYEEIGDRRGKAAALDNIGNVHQELGDLPTALEYKQRSLNILLQTNDKAAQARALAGIGDVYLLLEQYEESLEHLRRGLAVAEAAGDRHGQGMIFSNIGAVYYKLSDYKKALEFQEQGLHIFEQINNRRGEGIMLRSIGATYEALKQHTEAVFYYKKSLEPLESIGDRQEQLQTLSNLENIYQQMGLPAERQNVLERTKNLVQPTEQ